MKKFIFSVVVALTILGSLWFINQTDNSDQLLMADTLSYDVSVEIADIEGELEDHPRLDLYVSQLKTTQSAINIVKSDIENIKISLQDKKDQYDQGLIDINEDDQLLIGQSLKLIKLNQAMLEETIGDVYLRLNNIRDNHDLLSESRIKSILIDVYQTIHARQQMFENINQELINVQDILSIY